MLTHEVTVTICNESYDILVDARVDTSYDFTSETSYPDKTETPAYAFSLNEKPVAKKYNKSVHKLKLDYGDSLISMNREVPLIFLWGNGDEEHINLWSRVSVSVTEDAEVKFTQRSKNIGRDGGLFSPLKDQFLMTTQYEREKGYFESATVKNFITRQFVMAALWMDRIEVKGHPVTLRAVSTVGAKTLTLTFESTYGDLRSMIDIKLTSEIQRKMALNRFKEAMLLLNNLLESTLMNDKMEGRARTRAEASTIASATGTQQIMSIMRKENAAEYGHFHEFNNEYSQAISIFQAGKINAPRNAKQSFQDKIDAIEDKLKGNGHMDEAAYLMDDAMNMLNTAERTKNWEHYLRTADLCDRVKSELNETRKCYSKAAIQFGEFCSQEATIADFYLQVDDIAEDCRKVAIELMSPELSHDEIARAIRPYFGEGILQITEKVPQNVYFG